MKDRHGFDQGERRDTLPGPGAKKAQSGDLKGREMRSTNDGVKRAVIYIRVASAAKEAWEQAERQAIACREVAKRLGLVIVGEYRDLGGMRRPALHKMLSQLELTKASFAIAVHPSRFGRRVNENVAARAALAAAGVEAVFAEGPGHDPSVSSWAEVFGATAAEGGVR